MTTAHEGIFNATNGVHRDPFLSLSAANAVLDALQEVGMSSCPRGRPPTITAREAQRQVATVRERIEEADLMLFDAGVLVLSAKTNAARVAADRKITDARVKLERLRASLK